MAADNLDPTLPADNAPIVSAELRRQFQAIENRFDYAAAGRASVPASPDCAGRSRD